MGDKIRAVLAGMLTAALFLLAAPAAPAQAAVVLHGCDERGGDAWGALCLFDGTEYGKYQWRLYDVRAIAQKPGGCLTLTGFRNLTSSFAYNPTFTGQVAIGADRLRFWNGDYCTGASTNWPADTERADADLRTTANYGNISNWVNSVSIS